MRHPHLLLPRARAQNPQNRPAPDLSPNWPNGSRLCRFTRKQARRGLGPRWPNPAVVTCMALACRPANGFRGRSAGGTKRRKAMETEGVSGSFRVFHVGCRGGGGKSTRSPKNDGKRLANLPPGFGAQDGLAQVWSKRGPEVRLLTARVAVGCSFTCRPRRTRFCASALCVIVWNRRPFDSLEMPARIPCERIG